MNIHHPKRKLESAINKLKADENFSTENKKLILDFLDYLLAEGISECRVLKYFYVLKKTSGILNKEFLSINKKDATNFFKQINTNDMAEWTKHDYKVMVRKFYAWIKDEKENKPKNLKKAIDYIISYKIKRAKSKEKRAEHLITPEEVKKLAENTKYSRDKAFILTLYESGCRIGELLPTKIKDIEFDKFGAKLNVDGKTGFRPIRICASAPAISNWLTNHPDRENPDSFLFCGIGRTNHGRMLGYASARKIIFDAAERAGIKKRVNLHKFRASRATHLVIEGMSEPVLCDFGGWVIGSDEIRTYVKLSGKNVDNEILRINGLVKEKDKKNDFRIVTCPRCGIKNQPGAKFCSGCSLGLDEKSVREYDEQKEQFAEMGMNMQSIMQNEEFKKQLMNMIAKEWEKQKSK